MIEYQTKNKRTHHNTYIISSSYKLTENNYDIYLQAITNSSGQTSEHTQGKIVN